MNMSVFILFLLSFYRELFLSEEEKVKVINALQVSEAPFMQEYLMKILLFVADNIVAAEKKQTESVRFSHLDKVLGP